MNFTLSLLARKDLSNIWEYTNEHWSSHQADDYIHRIFDAIGKLCKHPHSGADYSIVRKGYRGIKVKSHIVFYLIGKGKEVIIVRVLHQKMDIKSRLGK